MGVQTADGPLVVDADDPRLTHRGTTIAVKVRSMVWPVVLGVVLDKSGSWVVDADLTGDLFGSDPPGGGDVVAGWVKHEGGGDMLAFVRKIVLPRLNAWLAALWPATDTPPRAETPLAQLHAALGSIRFVTHADGTVHAEI